MPQSCFHCGLPVPEHTHLPIVYDNQEQPTCCVGCQAVAQGIIDAGLGSYYKNRTAQAEKAELPPDEIMAQLKLYDLPEVQAEFVETLPEHQREATLMLGGITCAACVWLIEQRLMRQAGISQVELNYSTQRARVRWDETRVQLSNILSLIQKTGYTAAPYDAQKMEAQTQRERKSMLIRLAIAAFASMQTMMFALPTYLFGDIEPQYLAMLHWGAFFMVLPAMFYAALPFYQGAWRDLKNGRTGMDTPVALAISLTFIAGVGALAVQSQQGLYFESIAMFVFFLLLGRFMEHSARRKAGDAAERLVKLVPAFCHRLPRYPEETSEEAAVASLAVGDVLLVRAGEVVPVDGVILSGESEINEAMLTGEHLPVAKFSGCLVTAGTLNVASPIIIRATEVGNQTRLAHIVKLLDKALAQKPRLAELAERYASGFTLSLIIMAVPTFLAWWWYADAARALWVTVSLLVITCPCALSLATPAALAASTGKLASEGVLIAHGQALENLAQITDAVFDKTGTLTQGKLAITHIYSFAEQRLYDETTFSGCPGELIAIAQALEHQSEHPIAQAFFRLPHAAPQAVASQRQNHVGQGITAQIAQQTWAIGRADFVAQIAPSAPQRQPENLPDGLPTGSIIMLGNEHGFQAAFILRDETKPHAPAMLAELHARGIATHVLSGDHPNAVNQLADQLAIAHRRAQATPEDKLAYVQALQNQSKRVLMLGDGINDAPVLAAANVSLAVAGSADVAREGADVILLQDDLALIPRLLRQAQRTRRIIRQNLIWASVYNLIVVPLAVAGWITPWLAAIGMSASSLIVVGNALRLRK